MQNHTDAEAQMLSEQQNVEYDVKEYVVEILVNHLNEKELVIPDYQRDLVWKKDKQSKFIESVILGLPIPFLFGADLGDGRIEVVDGSQRLRTLKQFMEDQLKLEKLEKLNLLNGYKYSNLPTVQQRKFRKRSIRLIVLSEKSDSAIRFDVFERINSGSVQLSPAEFRKGAFQNAFYKMVLDCAENEDFQQLCPIGRGKQLRGEHAELCLRFFAYSENYHEFRHDVAAFLNRYVQSKDSATEEMIAKWKEEFLTMVRFVKNEFPYGFRKDSKARDTPRVRFEAIAVGAWLAIKARPNLQNVDTSWLNSDEFREHTTTHASNSGPRLRGRIDFVRDRLLDS
jgi:Protein of unknown function DUF262